MFTPVPARSISSRRRRWVVKLYTLVLAGGFSVALAASVTDFSNGLLNFVVNRWGRSAMIRLLSWQEENKQIQSKYPNLSQTMSSTDLTRVDATVLNSANDFFNKLPYYRDPQHWGVPVYWATPVEFVGSNGGDCVDYTIAKYFTLKDQGVPLGRLRLTYVRALEYNEAHMVLAYYPSPDSDPWILDNLKGDIRPASQRPDLEPVYSFNDDDLWMASGEKKSGGAVQIRLWKDLLQKMERERSM